MERILLNKLKRNKILYISLFTAIIGIIIAVISIMNNVTHSRERLSSSITTERKEIYHIISKFDMMPSAASRAIPAIAHIALDRKLPYRKTTKHGQLGFNVYKPLRKHYQSLGSGVIVTSDGYILTNNHVVKDFPGQIRVEIGSKKSYDVKIIGTDPKTDLAVIKIDEKDLPYIKFGDSSSVRVGDVVLAIGNPFGIGESVTMGIISATGRSNIGIVDYEDFIQTDAAINPGNSGGALVDIRGELIGINTAILTKSGGYEGISFAIPSNIALKVFNEIVTKGKVERGWVGIAVQNMDYSTPEFPGFTVNKGLLVVDVVKGSPASISGLKKDDILVSVSGIGLNDKNHLRSLVSSASIGETLNFRVLRDKDFINVPVNISKLPDDVNIFDVNH